MYGSISFLHCRPSHGFLQPRINLATFNFTATEKTIPKNRLFPHALLPLTPPPLLSTPPLPPPPQRLFHKTVCFLLSFIHQQHYCRRHHRRLHLRPPPAARTAAPTAVSSTPTVAAAASTIAAAACIPVRHRRRRCPPRVVRCLAARRPAPTGTAQRRPTLLDAARRRFSHRRFDGAAHPTPPLFLKRRQA